MWVWAWDPCTKHPCFDLSASRGCSFGDFSLKFSKYPPMSELARNTMWALAPNPPAWSCVGFGHQKHLLQYFLFSSDRDLYTLLAAPSAWWGSLSPDQNWHGLGLCLFPLVYSPTFYIPPNPLRRVDQILWGILRLWPMGFPGLFPEEQSGKWIFSAGQHSISLSGLHGLGFHNGADTLILSVSHFHRTQGEFRVVGCSSLLTFKLKPWMPAMSLL